MDINFEKGWLPSRMRTEDEGSVFEPITKVEYAIHILSRVKWVNLAIIVGLIFGIGYGVVSMANDVAEALPNWQEERHLRYMESELAKYEQVEILIQEGDTAWSIQQRLTPNERDLRHPLYLAKEINEESDWGNLIPGQRLVFLKAK